MAKASRRKFGPSQKDRIFFAILPDDATAARIYALTEKLKVANNFTGTLIRPEHLHITLFHLGDWNGLPQSIVDIAAKTASEIAAAPFDIACTRTESFRNSTGVYPFVLLPEQSATPLRTFHAALGAALKRNGLGGATQGEFKPHVTLLRDGLRAKPAPVAPIAWTARDFVLVHSLLGKTTHIHIGRWPLIAP